MRRVRRSERGREGWRQMDGSPMVELALRFKGTKIVYGSVVLVT